ncbi:MAG TPA: ACP S-malonyltransferase, partial [Gemmatimonadales bacterium]|nr:ACP S-malonyltransferase [Gemmatimonadales bacterium]
MWLCPGQGAQKVGMAKDLAERFPAAREVLQAVDDALETPLSRLMFEGPDEDLTATHNAQPAILAHSAAVFAVVRECGGRVVAAAGHSLGEYSAYVTAGALEATEAAKLVRRRGELMQKAGAERPGTMAAV